VVIAMLYTSIGIGIYWLVLVSLEANIIGYWILGAFLGIVLTLFILVTNICLQMLLISVFTAHEHLEFAFIFDVNIFTEMSKKTYVDVSVLSLNVAVALYFG